MEIKLRDFESQILYFNGMYKLPVAPYPTVFKLIEHEVGRNKVEGWTGKDYLIRRLLDFRKILVDEMNEVDEIVAKLKLGVQDTGPDAEDYTELDCLTDLADWLGDIQVYCASEMAKLGIPQKETLRIIMSSNFSKLGADGLPIYDKNGKVQKGPMYWKPEPQLRSMLQERIEDVLAVNKPTLETGIVWRVGGN